MYLSADQQSRLKRDLNLYKQASEKTGVPWLLLAAIHYRENSLLPSAGLGSCMRFTPPSVGTGLARKYQGQAGRTLTDLESNTLSALICAGYFLQEKMGGQLRTNSPRSLMLRAAYLYNGTGYGDIQRSPYVYSDPQNGRKMYVVGTDYDVRGNVIKINVLDGKAGVAVIIPEIERVVKGSTGGEEPAYGDKTVFYPVSKWSDCRIDAVFLDRNYSKWRVNHGMKPAEHTGIDVNFGSGDADLGRAVYAVADGKVIASAYYPTWGNIVLIYHPQFGMVMSQSAHLRERYVKTGDFVQGGTCIGTIGKGDGSFSAHLHFEIRIADIRADAWPGTNAPYIREHYTDPVEWLRVKRARDVDNGVDDLHPTLQKVRDQLKTFISQRYPGARLEVWRDYAPALIVGNARGADQADAAKRNPHTVRPALAFDFHIIRNGSKLATTDAAYAAAGAEADRLGAAWGATVKTVPGEGGNLRNHVQLKNAPEAIRQMQQRVERGIIPSGIVSGDVAAQDAAPTPGTESRGAPCPNSIAG